MLQSENNISLMCVGRWKGVIDKRMVDLILEMSQPSNVLVGWYNIATDIVCQCGAKITISTVDKKMVQIIVNQQKGHLYIYTDDNNPHPRIRVVVSPTVMIGTTIPPNDCSVESETISEVMLCRV